ncbi:MAG: DUF1343 domain-containing protein [Gemmatimonadales bacterium]|nr:DUF1343 domain-containing protein [Gemmatimonadales bacterium]
MRPGIEVLLSDSMQLVRGRRVGLVTNQTGIDRSGRRDVDRMLAAGIRVTMLFGPEHGLYGRIDVDTRVDQAHFIDSTTGLPAYVLHTGAAPIAPTPEMLADVDVLVIDLQDVGARYYTYPVTAALVMEAAARAHLPVVMLDRPNPIGGLVQGNSTDSLGRSAVARFPVAMRHGMTIGEVARMTRALLGLDVDLHVVPVAGWRRSMTYENTGLPWVPPSLNLSTTESLFHYPGLCLFEGTNLSVGRGTDAPFRQVGAPWLDTTQVLATLRAARLPGVRFSGVEFTPIRPGDGKLAGQRVPGIRLTLTDAAIYDPTVTAAHLLAALQAHHAGMFAFQPAQFDRLAGGSELREAILRGERAESITAGWGPSRARFLARRAPYLIY